MSGFLEPAADTADPAELFARYLAYFRETAVSKVAALPAGEQRTSRVGSGWTPIELLNHLAFMERRWLVWGFLGEQVEQPWGDAEEHRWRADSSVTVDQVAAALEETRRRTEEVLKSRSLDETGAVGGRFTDNPPTLAWICFHVLQEYARHLGHLDIAVELAGGPTGE